MPVHECLLEKPNGLFGESRMTNNANDDNYVVCKITSTDKKYDGLTVVLSLEDFINSLEKTNFVEQLNETPIRHRIQDF